ncbi:hypothetical protein [Hydrogenophaga sp. 5NK40-0174]|uniref:hypothetical protein n=1 Tax=Hydrogenophaga sp. 5NK40-0174 TaxID=3127649 RepID=UPI003101F642
MIQVHRMDADTRFIDSRTPIRIMTPSRRHITICLISVTALLGGCDAVGIETVPQYNARKEAEGKAIGSACRHAVRSIESCFRSNPKAPKAAVFAGWKEMDSYMRENEVVGMPTPPGEEASPPSGEHEETPTGGHEDGKKHS